MRKNLPEVYMPEEITPEIFNRLTELASLEVTEEEAEYLRQELNHQLASVRDLQSVPLEEETPITLHGVPYPPEISSPLRADLPRAYSDPDKILAQAPESEERYIIVPEIPHTDLD